MLPATYSSTGSESGSESFDPSLLMVVVLAALLGVGAGLIFGVAQWTVLRRHAGRAGQWITGNAIGWAVAMVWIFLAASLPSEGVALGWIIVLGVVAGILAGLSVGAITGVFLLRLEPGREHE